ncbi:unnamed protein product [Prorocentrum cordatum]|uniref:Uncharacterized protein n=1 Tax=Prorocentrum cordatum TaxID=2364126 RepID=A0ABN9S5L3_9DINO|nr:unnamed protein product [Polarella glacialis]
MSQPGAAPCNSGSLLLQIARRGRPVRPGGGVALRLGVQGLAHERPAGRERLGAAAVACGATSGGGPQGGGGVDAGRPWAAGDKERHCGWPGGHRGARAARETVPPPVAAREATAARPNAGPAGAAARTAAVARPSA